MVCEFSRVAFSVFGLPIHWYSLAYIFGILVSLWLTSELARRSASQVKKEHLEAFISYAVVGIIVGGRLGHVFFYDFSNYAAYPYEIFKIWKGGMSFFGGFLGITVVSYVFCRKNEIDFLRFADLWSVSAPVGLFLGRIANFINGELLGSESNLPWSVIFPHDGVSRHPSQLYESILEGVVLFGVMLLAFQKKCYQFQGRLSGIFCIGYGGARFCCEFFRMPDSDFSFRLLCNTGINLNQYISFAMIVFGCALFGRSYGKKDV